MRLQHTPYSYRTDPAVPAFDDRGPIVFMDAECVLCSWGARTIARLDRNGAFRICPVQSRLGQAVLTHYGLDTADPETWLYLNAGRPETGFDAVMKAGRKLGGFGYLPSILAPLPRGARDWLYRRMARNRYRLFGRTDMCALPDPALRARLME